MCANAGALNRVTHWRVGPGFVMGSGGGGGGGEGSEHIESLGHRTELTGLHLGALDWVPETGSRYFRSVLV